jgi:hypothetical protein
MGQIERIIQQPVAAAPLLLLCLILCAVFAAVAVRASRRRAADRAAMRGAVAEARAVRRLLGQVRGDLRNAALAVHGHADRLRASAPPGSEAAAQAGSVILLAARMLTLAEDAGDATAEAGDAGAGDAGTGSAGTGSAGAGNGGARNGGARRPPALDAAWLPLADLLSDAVAATTAGLGPAGRVWRIGPAVRDWAVGGHCRRCCPACSSTPSAPAAMATGSRSMRFARESGWWSAWRTRAPGSRGRIRRARAAAGSALASRARGS